MPVFKFKAVVSRMVTDEINLDVEADTEDLAKLKASIVLDSFPEEHIQDGVPYCYISSREYHEPELVSLEPAQDVAVG